MDELGDLPGGSVGANPLFDPWSQKIPRSMEQRSQRATATAPVLLSPWAATMEAWAPGACAPQQKLPQWDLTPQRRGAPAAHS